MEGVAERRNRPLSGGRQTNWLKFYALLDESMRRLLYVNSALVLVIGIPLYVLSDQTDTYFAWTIHPPLTAAVLGAGYWASFVLELLSARERLWARTRLAVPAVLVFSTLTLAITLVHDDSSHRGRCAR